MTALVADPRHRELAAALHRLRERIAAAADAAGRSPAEITLVAVTKTYPAEDVQRLAALGVADFGENRAGELAAKRPAAPHARWHCVGRLQSRQTLVVATHADVVHSVDRVKLALRLGRQASESGRTLQAFVQLSLDGDPARGGAVAADLPALADAVAATAGLALIGVMVMPPSEMDPVVAYRQAAVVAALIRRAHPSATAFSAGMSADLEAAVAAGATHLRIGTALLGHRPAPVG